MGRYTRAVSGQRLGKHVPAATNTNGTIEELCFLCGLCRDVTSKGQGHLIVLYGREGAGGRGVAIVGAVTRKRLITD
jgi:hypothetical protein